MRKAIGYVRCSTDRQETSLEDQKREIKRYAGENGYELLRFYEDDAVSGTSVKGRDGFKKMVEDATSRPDFSAVLVWDVKRFSRGDSDEAGHYRYLLRQNEVEVIYISENLRGDDSDDLVLPTKQWLARQESKDKSRDSIRGQLSRIINKGLSSSGHPYAYYRQIIDKDGNEIQVCKRGEKARAGSEDYTKLIPGDPKEIKVVRRIFDCYANKGMGKRLIARMLNQEGIPSSRGKKWNLCAIDFILSNQVYIGNLVYNKTSKAKFHRIVKTDRGYEAQYKGKVAKVKMERYRDKSQWIVIEGAVEAIISKELFEKAQRARQERAKEKSFSGRATTSEYLWTGLIRCRFCGKAMNGTRIKMKSGAYSYYVCYGCVELGNRKKSVVSAMQLDSFILNRIKERLINSDRLRSTLEAIKEGLSDQRRDTEPDIHKIEARVVEIDRKIDGLLDSIDPRHRDLINEKLDKLKQEKETLLAEKERPPILKVDTDKLAGEILRGVARLDRVLAQGTPSERKEYIRSYVGQIVIDTDSRHAEVGYYPLPKIPATQALLDSLCIGSGVKSDTYVCTDSGMMIRPLLMYARASWCSFGMTCSMK